MKIRTPFCERVRVLHHGNGETTHIEFLRGGTTQIPTGIIPIHLRKIGSEFFLLMPDFTVEPEDQLETIRKICASYKVADFD